MIKPSNTHPEIIFSSCLPFCASVIVQKQTFLSVTEFVFVTKSASLKHRFLLS